MALGGAWVAWKLKGRWRLGAVKLGFRARWGVGFPPDFEALCGWMGLGTQ